MDQLPGEWTKTCSHCRRELPLDGFARKTRSRDGRQAWCRDCNAERSKQYHLERKAEHIKAIRERTLRLRAEYQLRLYEFLRTQSCADCGESDPVVLEFDHVRGKKLYNVSQLIGSSRNWTLIEAEMAKCEVVCANCHRRRTYRRQGSHRSRWSK